MHILISGGTGFLGSKIAHHLVEWGHQVTLLSRAEKKSSREKSVAVVTELNPETDVYDVIINLAGEPLNKSRWNEKVKKNIYDSRIKNTEKLVSYIGLSLNKPKLFLTGSAIGFYGSSLSQVFTESSPPGDQSYIHKLCAAWEVAGSKAAEHGVRVCTIRTGIVLDRDHGALAEMLPLFKMGLGGRIGHGDQWMSWIHIDDFVAAVSFLINHDTLEGPFNLTAPKPERNAVFTKILAKTIGRPSLFPIPGFLMKAIFGEMADFLLLKGQQVRPEKLLENGYSFKFPHLEEALKDIIKRPLNG